MAARAKLVDVARKAGVSAATVDRVLHTRAGVSARTRALVIEAARDLGYLPAHNALQLAPLRVQLILPHGSNAYIAELARQAHDQAAAMPSIMVEMVRTRGLDPLNLANALHRAVEGADAVAVVAVNHPAVKEAIRALAAAGKPVVTLASDLPDAPRLAYVGVDNSQAGRLAGYTLGRFVGSNRDGAVALFAGSMVYRGHHEREMGFRQILAEEYPDLRVLELRESSEDRKKAYGQAVSLFREQPDLVGIYNAGGATVGIAAALEDVGRATSTVFIAHEATEENKAYLISGTLDAVIDQDARAQIAQTFGLLAAANSSTDSAPEPVPLNLIVRENLPPR